MLLNATAPAPVVDTIHPARSEAKSEFVTKLPEALVLVHPERSTAKSGLVTRLAARLSVWQAVAFADDLKLT